MGGKGSGTKKGAPRDPARCRVTVYKCCLRTLSKNSSFLADGWGHQCHEAHVKDGLCLRHLGERIRLLRAL